MSEPAPFDVNRVSPSRIGLFADCGTAYKFKYIDQVPSERSGSAALFGKVMHRARESWVLDPKNLSLPDLTEKAWHQETEHDQVIRQFLDRYRSLSAKARATMKQIQLERPDIKNVRATKDWKESPVAIQIANLIREWEGPINERSQYTFGANDPLPSLYDESLQLARRYGRDNRHRPPAYATEFGFEFEWRSKFILNGYIDEICPLIDQNSGEQFGIGVVDAKTYRNVPKHEAKDWRQLVTYTLAVKYYRHAGVLDLPDLPIYQGVDRMRLGEFVWYKFGKDEERRLLNELRMYRRGVKAQVFVPAAKTCNADWCDFKRHCEHWHENASKEVLLNVA